MLRMVGGALAMAVLLAGCQSHGVGPRQEIGALTGAIGGAFLGNDVGKGRGRVLATAAGTVAGMAIGADIGRSLDRANAAYVARRPVAHSQQTPVPGFAPSPHISSGHHGAGGTYRAVAANGSTIRDALDCRTLDEGGLRPTFACRNRTGQWFILQ